MGYGYAYDGPPTKCLGRARKGTKALRAGVIEAFPHVGDQGIYNCRDVRGGGTLSFHADGRAWDAKCAGQLNADVAAFLVEHADALGIQEVISRRRRWDSRTRKWVDYHGVDDHTTHVHVSQCIAAANALTIDDVRAVTDPTPTPTPVPQEDDTVLLIEVTDGGDKGVWLDHAGTLRKQSKVTADALLAGPTPTPYVFRNGEAFAQIRASAVRVQG